MLSGHVSRLIDGSRWVLW